VTPPSRVVVPIGTPSRASARVANGSPSATWQAATQLDDVPARRGAGMVEGDDAVRLGAGDIQSLGDQQLGGFINITKFLLQSVDDRQQPTGCRLLGGDDDGVGLGISQKGRSALYASYFTYAVGSVRQVSI
jgi:hypothetical protein